MSDRSPEESRLASDLEHLAGELDGIELAAAIADGGIEPAELTDDQLRILLREESADVVAAMLSEEVKEAGQAQVRDEQGSDSLSFLEYVRRWSPAIGSLAVAAAIVIVGIVGFRPAPGLEWDAAASLAMSGHLTKSAVSDFDRPLIAFLNSGEYSLVVIDSMSHNNENGLSFGLGRLDSEGRLRPHAIVTFLAIGEQDQQSPPDLPGTGDLADGSWIDRLCEHGYRNFAASTADGSACWGQIDSSCQDHVFAVWRKTSPAWMLVEPIDSDSDRTANPATILSKHHHAAFDGSPFPRVPAWNE